MIRRLPVFAGLPASSELPRRSLRPRLDDPSQAWKSQAITQVRRWGKTKTFAGYALRTERCRYVEWDGGRLGVGLYDHDNAPREFHNLANDPQHAETEAALRRQLHDARRD